MFIFGNKEIPDDDLFIANQQLAVVDKMKLLGVIIRDDLKWDGQVENMCTKANQKSRCKKLQGWCEQYKLNCKYPKFYKILQIRHK